MIGFHPKRSFPKLSHKTLSRWFKTHTPHRNAGSRGKVFLFCDEFTNYLDAHVGVATIELLEMIGYSVEIPKHLESGRAAISKGMLKKAQSIAAKNVQQLHPIVAQDTPLIGIEPSAILTFRDEYPDLVPTPLQNIANELASNTFLIDEFLDRDFQNGNLNSDQFTTKAKKNTTSWPLPPKGPFIVGRHKTYFANSRQL